MEAIQTMSALAVVPRRSIPALFGDAEADHYLALRPAQQIEHEVRMRAFFLSQRPDRQGRSAEDNWLEAERRERW